MTSAVCARVMHDPQQRMAPPIAGRSTSYIVRQLNDIRSGTRAGAGAALMKPVVADLTTDDMIAIAAYVASRDP